MPAAEVLDAEQANALIGNTAPQGQPVKFSSAMNMHLAAAPKQDEHGDHIRAHAWKKL